jgi:F-type H+-transporting ATPase subunit gamma
MSDTLENLRRKIAGAGELDSVVRTMKVLAASSIGQYERAVEALVDYSRTVELGLSACFRESRPATGEDRARRAGIGATGAIVVGSDQGLIGQFNDVLTEFALTSLQALPGEKRIWAVGERIRSRLSDGGLPPAGLFPVPTSVTAITPLVGQLLIAIERARGDISQVFVFHNRPLGSATYEPVSQRLLPLDEHWHRSFAQVPWPTRYLAEVRGGAQAVLETLIREYLFVTLYRTSAESLASENASRLAAMQRAEKNIGELLEDLRHTFHRLRQSVIDEELFDVVSGFEALSNSRPGTHAGP